MAVAALSLVTASVGPAAARGTRQRAGAFGRFDYYVLSLSWSPQHCAQTRPAANDPQCAVPRRFGFVAHGLWPQYERGYPSSCATGAAPDAALVDGMLDIMPSPTLVRHEWAKHGSCSGLDPAGYFALIEKPPDAHFVGRMQGEHLSFASQYQPVFAGLASGQAALAGFWEVPLAIPAHLTPTHVIPRACLTRVTLAPVVRGDGEVFGIRYAHLHSRKAAISVEPKAVPVARFESGGLAQWRVRVEGGEAPRQKRQRH